MISTDLNNVTAQELIQHLQQTEQNAVITNLYDANASGFDLYFVPTAMYATHISNIEVVVKWAEAHKHTVSVGYDSHKEAIVVHLQRLYPDTEYSKAELV